MLYHLPYSLSIYLQSVAQLGLRLCGILRRGNGPSGCVFAFNPIITTATPSPCIPAAAMNQYSDSADCARLTFSNGLGSIIGSGDPGVCVRRFALSV